MASTISHYRIIDKLGAGGMGEVFLAEDVTLERKVALKLLPPTFQADATARRRLMQEAKIAASIDHPYVCKIYEVGEAEGQVFIGMEFVEGQSLDAMVDSGPLPVETALRVGLEIGEALQTAHEKGVVHRDLKPSNVMLTPDGHVKVMDFGLAMRAAADLSAAPTITRLTQEGVVLGTPGYMAPEQVLGQAPDARADIFAMGVILCELLTGSQLFKGSTLLATAMAVLQDDPEPLIAQRPEWPDGLSWVLGKMLAKEPDARYRAAGDIVADLRRLLKSSGPRVPPPPRRLHLAVLPFVNLSGDAENDYFSDGITEEIIARLSSIPGLSVIARSSSMRYKGSTRPLSEVAEALGVDAVLEGSVRLSTGRVRLVATLVDARSSRQMWADAYEAELGQVFATQRELADRVARALRPSVSLAGSTASPREGSRLIEAYHLYLRGRHLLGHATFPDIQKAITCFEEALRLDTEYAVCHAGIATSYATCGIFNYMPHRECFPLARNASRRALDLDDSLAEAHAAAAVVMFLYDWDWTGTRGALDRATQLNPSLADAHMYRSWYLCAIYRPDEALAAARRALSLDPLSPIIGTNLGWILTLAGFYDESIEQLQKVLELHPSFLPARTELANPYWAKGLHDESVRILQESVWWSKAFLGWCHAMLGRHEEARGILEEVLQEFQDPAHGHHSPFDIGMIHYHLGEREAAYRWMERAYRERDLRLVYLKSTLAFGHLPASDPWLNDLVRRMGLDS